MGEDARGRKCAVNAIKIERRGGMGLGSVLGLALLLILPVLAVRQIALSVKIVAGHAFRNPCCICLKFWEDGRVHFVAQRWLRHKTSKTSFKIVFWLIVLIRQYVAMDFSTAWEVPVRVN
jgi:hypothetical protein